MYRLLMVDENADRLEEAKMLLDWSNYGISSIITAGSYVEAVDKAMDLTPHIALVSLHLGKYEGYELAAHMRSIGLSTIFCILAEENDPELIRASMRCGVQDYLLYPLHAEEMQHFLARTLAHHLDGTQPEIGEAKKRLDPVLGVEYTDLSKITNKIILLVRSNFRAPQTLTAIAAELNMSAKYIGRVFIKDTGLKFSEYLMSYRMLEARKLIVSTQEKISVIANMVGYVHLNNFYTHFKTYFGVSPSALRNNTPTHAPDGSVSALGGSHEKSL